MPYQTISSRRMPYDIDGTEIGFRSMERLDNISQIIGNGLENWLDSTSKSNLNKEDRSQSWWVGDYRWGGAFWFFFPELREVNNIGFQWSSTTVCTFVSHLIQGSADSTNGVDGTWETGVYSIPPANTDMDHWRSKIFTISFSGPVKALRIGFRETNPQFNALNLCGIHIYGFKYAGETQDDILFVDSNTGVELTSLMDWGDRPEGTSMFKQLKIKNASSTKTANNINLQLNHSDFLMSWNPGGPWTTVLDITSLGAGASSGVIHLKNELGPPLLNLGPKAARIIASVGSWT